MNELVIYESEGGGIEVRLAHESVWLSQRQMAELLQTTPDNIGLHLKNIYADGELIEAATTEVSSVVQQEGGRRVARQVRQYNLDAIISVAYRVSSRRGVQFRQWATALLREHLVRGYTLNRQRFEANARELEAALELVRKTACSRELTGPAGRGLMDIVSRYAQTFLLLQRYDEGLLTEPATQVGGVLPTATEARAALARLKADLKSRGEATDLFALERDDGLAALLGNLDQTVMGEPAYPSIEAKAAHLLYFVIKNHPFADGNKRSGAFLLVDYESFDHFRGVTKMVGLGSGAKREVDDFMLTRYACYLIAQNGDPRKPTIAFAQSYFALQTRKQELVEDRLRLQARLPKALLKSTKTQSIRL